ncbi:MAG: NAD-dependent epimerase/dehydratase family protein [Phycisphaerae bacterium]
MTTFGDTPLSRVGIIGCGYVGLALARELRQRGVSVTGTTRGSTAPASFQEVGIQHACVVLPNATGLEAALHGCDTILFCPGPGRGADYDAVFHQGAQQICEAIDGNVCRQIVFLSSTRVYGQNAGEAVDESSDTSLADSNGQAIVRAENVLLSCPRLKCNVLRLGGIHGPGRRLIDRIQAASGQTRTDGHVLVNLVHLDDIVAAILLSFSHGDSGIFNIVDHQVEPRRELYDRILAAAALPPVHWKNESPAYCAGTLIGKRVSSRKATDELGWTPRGKRD